MFTTTFPPGAYGTRGAHTYDDEGGPDRLWQLFAWETERAVASGRYSLAQLAELTRENRLDLAAAQLRAYRPAGIR